MYCFEIPVTVDNMDDVLYQKVYFDCESNPTRNQVLRAIRNLQDSDGTFPKHLAIWKNIYEVLAGLKAWPEITGSMISCSIPIDTKFGERDLICSIIIPLKLENV